jgi:Anti-sigma-K factor rskA
MNATGHIEQDDLALLAMQLLPKDEHALIVAHLAQCAVCGRALAEVQGDLAVYAHTVDMHSPPAQVRERLMKQIAREKKAVPVERVSAAAPPSPEFAARKERPYRTGRGGGAYLGEDEEPKRSVAAKVFPWVGWAVAAGIAVVAGNLYHERDVLHSKMTAMAGQMDRGSSDAAAAKQVMEAMTDPAAKHVTMTMMPPTPAPPVPQGRVMYVAERGTLIFLASNMEPLQNYKTYQLWLIPANGHDPMPAGTFHPDERGNASVIMPPLPKGVEAKMFGVTVEDEGGSQTPTMPIIMAGS